MIHCKSRFCISFECYPYLEVIVKVCGREARALAGYIVTNVLTNFYWIAVKYLTADKQVPILQTLKRVIQDKFLLLLTAVSMLKLSHAWNLSGSVTQI